MKQRNSIHNLSGGDKAEIYVGDKYTNQHRIGDSERVGDLEVDNLQFTRKPSPRTNDVSSGRRIDSLN